MLSFTLLVVSIGVFVNEAAVIRKSNYGEAIDSKSMRKSWIEEEALWDSLPVGLKKSAGVEKSSKLLLLSSPKIAEKPKQPEEDLEESDEEIEMAENVTQVAVEMTTEALANEENTTLDFDIEPTKESQFVIADQTGTEDVPNAKSTVETGKKLSGDASMINLSSTERITKLYPINETSYRNNKKMEESPATAVGNQSIETPTSSIGFVALKEPRADCKLTQVSHSVIGSELLLQPNIQTIEILLPCSHGTLFFNCVPGF